jgi:pSer/pThr/pTyr-binding forkhead associated (FHA) protein
MEATQPMSRNRLAIRHRDGSVESRALPSADKPIRIGRGEDNDFVINDPRISRHHAQIRRTEAGLEILDLGSANGTNIDALELSPNEWYPLKVGQTVTMGGTQMVWEQLGASSEETVRMPAVSAPPKAAPVSPPEKAPPAPRPPAAAPGKRAAMPLAVLAGLFLALIVVAGVILFMIWRSSGATTGTPGETPLAGAITPTTGGQPTPPAGSGAGEVSIPYPVLEVKKVEVGPLMGGGGLPDTGRVRMFINIRVGNQGNAPFIVSTDQFRLVDEGGNSFEEGGKGVSDVLGLADRYENLSLGPGGSVPESLTFVVPAQWYRFFLQYKTEGVEPVTVDLGAVDAAAELAKLLGTPTPEVPLAVAQATPVVAVTPSPRPTRPPIPPPKTVPEKSLVGTIAYPVFNGESYDIYFGQVDGSGSSFFMKDASQPQFSANGNAIAYHSWLKYKRGLVTVLLSGAEEHIIGYYLEDQLPTWSPDGNELIFMSRRSGQRRSELFRAPRVVANAEEASTVVKQFGEGEYPTWGKDGRLYFKGWGRTGKGLQVADPDLLKVTALTDDETDTAPAPSPDGKKVAFMSYRGGDWEIYIVDVESKEVTRLTDEVGYDGLPAWSPDGEVIAFVSNRGGPWAVWAMNADGSGKTQLFTIEDTPDGQVAGEDSDKSRGWAEERISWKP